MATIAKKKYLGAGLSHRSLPGTTDSRASNRPDYFGLALVAMLMFGIMALAIWLASLGGATPQPLDPWMLMP